MIFDLRTYTVRPGTMAQHLALYEEYGMATQIEHLGEPVLYGTTETGDVNSFVHVWVYADVADRAARRQSMMADPQWQVYIKKSAELGALVSQQNAILQPSAFVPQRIAK